VLLTISQAIATVRDREALLHLIVDKVQPLFGFNEYTNLGTLTEDGRPPAPVLHQD
jgi:hypothetical protein